MIAAATLLLALAAAAPAEPPLPALTPAQTASAFYSAYGAGDVDALARLAEPETAAELRKRLARHLQTRCVQLLGSDVRETRIDGDRATVRIEAVLAEHPRNGLETIDAQDATLTLTRSPAGWRIASWKLRDEEIAEALIAAATDDERARIVSRNSDALTPRLDAVLGKRALQLVNLSRLEDSAALTGQLRSIATEIGDVRGLSDALGIDSARLRRPPRFDMKEATRRARAALALAEQTRDPDTLARALLRVSRAQVSETPWAQTTDATERVLEMRDDVEDLSVVSLAAGQLGNYWADNGFPRKSIAYGELARDLAATSGSKLALHNAEVTIGRIYEAAGDYEVALLHLLPALRLAEETSFRDGIAMIHTDIATAYHELGNDKEFFRHETLALAPGAAFDTIATAETSLARYELEHGRLAKAAAHTTKALAAAEHAADSRVLTQPLIVLAELRLAQHRFGEAIAAVQRAKKVVHERPMEVDTFLARALRGLHRTREAEEVYRASIRMTEEISELLVGDDRQLHKYLGQRAGTNSELADLLVERGDVAGGLAISDESKARTLLDSLQHRPRLIEARMTDAEHLRERELVARVSALRDAAKDTAGREALQQSRIELDALRAELRTKYDPLAPKPAAAAVTPAQLERLLPNRRSAFLEYLITDSRLRIFVIRRGANGRVAMRVRTIALERSALERTVSLYASSLASRDLGYRPRARRLYDLLLLPVARDLDGVDTIGIVADGALWRLPFETLVARDGRFVAERLATFYAPSLAAYAQMVAPAAPRTTRSPERLLAFANPPVPRPTDAVREGLRDEELSPLPDAEREVARIAALYGSGRSRLYIGADAREARVKDESSEYGVIHFATHALLDDANPMYSHLLLARREDGSDDGLLEAWEMMRLDLHADLAVLSACDTARGTYAAGEGMIGMSWALFVAGCRSTIVTEWKVNSAAAADLMVAFYRRWLPRRSEPFAKAAALQHARLELLRDPARRHPFYWAPYVLIGAAR